MKGLTTHIPGGSLLTRNSQYKGCRVGACPTFQEEQGVHWSPRWGERELGSEEIQSKGGALDLTGNCRSVFGQNFGFYSERLIPFLNGCYSLIHM